MKSTAKYMFDEDFATGEKPTMTVVEAERRRADAEAEAQAHRKGFAVGQAQAQNEAGQRVATALGLIADGLARLDRALNGIEARLETEAVEVAVAVAAKLAPELIARKPFVEISALATECFHQLVKTPHIVVRIGAEIYETAKDKLEEIARARGFEGRLVVMSDAAMTSGDCRIEWADGGVIRDQAATLSVIDDVVGRYVAGRTTTNH
jgi:flagellar assembly protein FliH